MLLYKYPFGMLVILEAERSSDDSDAHIPNTSWPTEVTEDGSTTEARPLMKKAAEPM